MSDLVLEMEDEIRKETELGNPGMSAHEYWGG